MVAFQEMPADEVSGSHELGCARATVEKRIGLLPHQP